VLIFAEQELLKMIKAFFLLFIILSLFVGLVYFLDVINELLSKANRCQKSELIHNWLHVYLDLKKSGVV